MTVKETHTGASLSGVPIFRPPAGLAGFRIIATDILRHRTRAELGSRELIFSPIAQLVRALH